MPRYSNNSHADRLPRGFALPAILASATWFAVGCAALHPPSDSALEPPAPDQTNLSLPDAQNGSILRAVVSDAFDSGAVVTAHASAGGSPQTRASAVAASSFDRPPANGIDAQIQYAFDLAARGAIHSAQAELIQVLKLISSALDAEHNTQQHTETLFAGLTALREADDFAPTDSLEPDHFDLELLIAKHKTNVLKKQKKPQMSRLLALEQYYTFARDRLARAVGRNRAAADAFYGLARAHSTLAVRGTIQNRLSGQKAILLHQVALAANPRHHRAANELGVLLVGFQQWQQAETAFVRSLSVSPTAEAWHNLATVYDRLGKSEAARRARDQFQATRSKSGGHGVPVASSGSVSIRWVEPDEFAKTFNSGGIDAPPVNPGLLGQPSAVKPRQVPATRVKRPSRGKFSNSLKKLGSLLRMPGGNASSIAH